MLCERFVVAFPGAPAFPLTCTPGSIYSTVMRFAKSYLYVSGVTPKIGPKKGYENAPCLLTGSL